MATHCQFQASSKGATGQNATLMCKKWIHMTWQCDLLENVVHIELGVLNMA